jgi:hypothetical protein
MVRPVRITISDKCLDAYLDYQRKKKIKAAERARQEIATAKMNRVLDSDVGSLGDSAASSGPAVDPVEAGKRYVQSTIEAAKMLGLTRPEPAAGFDFGKLLVGLVPLLPAILDFFSKQAERSEARMKEFIALMTTSNAANQAQMMELIKTASGANAGQTAVKQYQDMLTGIIDIKTELSGMGKPSVGDRIFQLLEGIAPHVVTLLSMPRQQALNDPRVKLAQTYAAVAPDFQAIKSDPAEQARLVAEMDAYYGWEQTDGILSVMRLFDRPATCPRRPDQRYPADDPRNKVETADFEPEDPQEAVGSTGEAIGDSTDGLGIGED